MPGPVLFGIEPIPGETLMSLVTRVVVRNILPSSHVILEQVGAPHAQNPTAAIVPGLDEALLAHILRQPVGEVTDRRHAPSDVEGFVQSFGVTVRADELVFRRRRFSPAAIAASPHIRATWSHKMVPCDTVTWEYLADACRCGAVQRWRAAYHLDRCDRCCRPLARVPAETVDPSLRYGLAFLIGLIDPAEDVRHAARAQLPGALHEWDGGMIFELALALTNLTATSYITRRGHQPPDDDLLCYTQALSQTADLIRGWPHSLVPALEAAVVDRSLSRRNVRYTGIADYIPALDSEVLPTIVREEINRVLAPIATAAGTTPDDQIAMMDAVDLSGWALGTLAEERRAGRLKTRICFRANRVFPALDRAEVVWLRDFRDNRKSAEALSSALHLPRYAVPQLADAGLLTIEKHPFVISLFDAHQLHKRELAEFVAALQAAQVPSDAIDNPIPLHRAARAIGGGLKPWGVIFSRMLTDASATDRIAFSMTGGSINRICISAADARALRNLDLRHTQPGVIAPRCSQRDALEILNLPAKHAHLLKRFAGADDEWLMDWGDVLRLAGDRITLTEMAARVDMNGAKLEALLESEGCPRSDDFGWLRTSALKALSRI